MSTQPLTPAQFGALTAAAFSAYWGAQNAYLVAQYNKAVATAPSLGQPAPAPPLLTIVNSALIIQLTEQAAVDASSVAPTQWLSTTMEVPYIPVPPTTGPTQPLMYTIGAAEPTLPGFYVVTDSNNSPIPDGVVINASNMTNPDGHTYIAHDFGPFGSVAAQRVS